ncbi:cytochrome C class I protein [Hyphomicrobium denitrificans 1NES1]|uniref:Cytochrome C class I protein n=1 Tax=Hyphomicrobium denitrificans 1NES1 TaxID=670307 RepID=N0B5E1_9HYPH|nr:cytochrome c [Hyphomicrobium denitrificans]AGK58759.1 cytochrome C class I protein [Hyphomicrobium denitrificans 1NES1]
MKFIAGFIAALAVLAAGGLIYIYSGTYNVAASNPHSPILGWVLVTARDKSIAARTDEVGPPPPPSPSSIKEGFEHFDEMCVACHGAPGVERGEVGKGLNPKPPDLVRLSKGIDPRQLFWVVKNGIRMTGMPSFGATHNDHAIWNIVAFLKELPATTAQKYQDMKKELAASQSSGHEHDHNH